MNYIGIDLGTTNSAICSYDGETVRLYKSPDQNDVTPSAIFIDRRGNKYLGKRAYDSAAKNPDIRFIVHGPRAELEGLIARRSELAGRCDLRDAAGVVTMDDKPSQVLRKGEGTSMWSALESVRSGEALAAVSCGNTGALMAVSMLRLRKLPGLNRPAIASLFPTPTPGKLNVMLDMGADVKADPTDLLQYAFMGASYARNGLAITRPRVGLLNVGTEEHKGRAELQEAHALLGRSTEAVT